jgi:hypothetical protein
VLTRSAAPQAVWDLMDCPHPLETLADPGAYLASGIISRFHNPEHYTKALARITHLSRQVRCTVMRLVARKLKMLVGVNPVGLVARGAQL